MNMLIHVDLNSKIYSPVCCCERMEEPRGGNSLKNGNDSIRSKSKKACLSRDGIMTDKEDMRSTRLPSLSIRAASGTTMSRA